MSYEIFEELCNTNHIKPAQVSKATGIATSTLTSWKKGIYTPKQDKLRLIAEYFGVPIDYLTGKSQDSHRVLSDLEYEIILAYRQLSVDAKELFLRSLGLELPNERKKQA